MPARYQKRIPHAFLVPQSLFVPASCPLMWRTKTPVQQKGFCLDFPPPFLGANFSSLGCPNWHVSMMVKSSTKPKGYFYLSIYLSVYLSIYLSVYLSIYPSIYLSTHVYVYLNACMYVHVCAYVCVCLAISTASEASGRYNGVPCWT